METPRRTRVINLSRVTRELWIHGDQSRSRLAKSLNLNKSTVTSIIEDLIQKGLVLEGAETQAGPKGGRKATKLSLNPDCGYVLGFELRPESYTVLAVDIHGQIHYTKSEMRGFSASNLKNDFTELLASVQRELSWLTKPLLGVGVGVSGIVNSDRQIIQSSIPLQFTKEFDFFQEVSKHYDFPVLVENDANCGAWGEMVFHRSRNLQNFMFLLIEFWENASFGDGMPQPALGIGLGIGGRIYHGINYSAGEFKSILNNDPTSTQQIAVTADRNIRKFLPDNKAIMEQYITELSRNIALIVNTFNMSQVFIGGDTQMFKELLPEILKKEIRANWTYPELYPCEIQFSSLGSSSVAYGAAGHVLDKLFIDLEPIDHPEDHRLDNLFYLK